MDEGKITKRTKQEPFVMVYHYMLESDLLTDNELRLYLILLKRADSENKCFPSLKTLSKNMNKGKSQIQNLLKNLENKGVLLVENRKSPNGDYTSNMYTILDYKELFIPKEKESLEEETVQSITSQSSQECQYYSNDNTISEDKSQDRYPFEWIKNHFDYNILINDYPDRVIEWDYVIDIIYDVCNSSRSSIKVSSEDKSINVVISRLLKLNYTNIIYAVDQVKKQTNKIHNPRAYMISALYNSIDAEIATINQVNVDISEGKI